MYPTAGQIATRFVIQFAVGWMAFALNLIQCFGVSPTIRSVNPNGGTVGSSIEMILSGSRLEDIQELILYSEGLSVRALEPRGSNRVRAMIEIAPDCRLGEHQFRARTLSGLTEVRTFHVGPFPILKETEPNNERTQAQMVPRNTTVSGTITSEDVDFFEFKGTKGERVSVELDAIRLGRVLFDGYIAITDSRGAILARCDDSILFLQDPVLSMMVPEDGFYQVQVRDTSWGGADDFHYRLHLGNFPRPTVVYPLGGPGGVPTEVTFLGDPKGPIRQTISPPKDGGETFEAIAKSEGTRSPSGNRFRVVAFPNVLESGDNQALTNACPATMPVPVAFNGILSQPGEKDWFSFSALRKQPLELSIYARRLRSPVDSVLQLCDASGKVLDTNDDGAGPDSVIKFTPEESGKYYLRVSDQLGRGGPEYAYRVEVTAPAPRVVLSIPEVARYDTQGRQAIGVPRGNRVATLMRARRSSFNGDLQFDVPGLPTGMTVHAEAMPAGVDVMPWVFAAAADAPMDGGKLVEPVARPKASEVVLRSRYRHSLELVRGGNDQVYYATDNARLAVAVVQEVPFMLRVVAPVVPLVRAGNLKLKVEVDRRAGFDGPITVKMPWNPPGVNSEAEMTVPKGKSAIEYAVSAKADAPLADWKIVLEGSTAYKGGTVWASSELTPLRVTEPFLLGKIAPVMTEPGKTVQVRCQLDQREPFEGKVVAKLIGLPDKAQTQDREITKDDKELVFDVTLDPSIPVGSHKNLACQVQIRQGGETIVQTIGAGGILRIVPPKKTLVPKKLVSAADAGAAK